MEKVTGISILKQAHINGISFRLGIPTSELQTFFNEQKISVKIESGTSMSSPTRKKILAAVNKINEDRGIRFSHPNISESWFFIYEPDLVDTHIPDFVTGQAIVDGSQQLKSKDTITGLYYLYRCHGRYIGKGAVREILLIHAPHGESVRVHLINKSGCIYTGLSYKQRNVLNIPLYRMSTSHGYTSRFLLLDGPFDTRVSRINGTMLRISGSKHQPIASGVVLMPQDLSLKQLATVKQEIADVRVRDEVDIDFSNTQLALKKYAPKASIPWSNDEVSNLANFLQSRVFRNDNLNLQDDPDKDSGSNLSD